MKVFFTTVSVMLGIFVSLLVMFLALILAIGSPFLLLVLAGLGLVIGLFINGRRSNKRRNGLTNGVRCNPSTQNSNSG